jgi:hypothetical protein
MSGHKTIVGILLLCAVAVLAFAAPSALATGTTAFTCAEGGGEKDFTDAHCTSSTKAGEGKFGHIAIANGTPTELTLSNEKTGGETTSALPSVLAGKISGVNVKVECKKITGTGTLTNEEVGGTMRTTGNTLMEHSECSVVEPATCSVKTPIVYDSKFTTYQAEAKMGLEFTPRVGTQFGTFTLMNNGAETCAIKGTIGISGSFEGTPGGTPMGGGATLVLNANAGKLTWGSNTYTLDATITARMKGGNPIDFTT